MDRRSSCNSETFDRRISRLLNCERVGREYEGRSVRFRSCVKLTYVYAIRKKMGIHRGNEQTPFGETCGSGTLCLPLQQKVLGSNTANTTPLNLLSSGKFKDNQTTRRFWVTMKGEPIIMETCLVSHFIYLLLFWQNPILWGIGKRSLGVLFVAYWKKKPFCSRSDGVK